jgi:putative oxidoreductase
MKKLMSTRYSGAAFNIATFALRLTFGMMMFLNHGLTKLDKYSDMQNTFFDPFHLGHKLSLSLVIFSEVGCALLLVLGLFSRLVAFILLFEMLVAIFFFHKGQPVANFEIAVLHAGAYFTLLLLGPGKISIDGMTGK